MKKQFLVLGAIIVVAGVAALWRSFHTTSPSPSSMVVTKASTVASATTSTVTPTPAETAASLLVLPMEHASERITKKFYGTYVTPQHSPVSPERFTGYHTGLDFETFPDEQNTDVSVHAICTGPLLLKKWATGYGGVVMQECAVATEAVSVVYGHVRLSSVSTTVNQRVNAGDVLGVLGRGYSAETDGERKHLHLGIHKGVTITLAGYVQSEGALAAWLDPRSVLGL